jgi:hypothetical protein
MERWRLARFVAGWKPALPVSAGGTPALHMLTPNADLIDTLTVNGNGTR